MNTGFRPAPGAEFYLNGTWHQIQDASITEGFVTYVDAEGVLSTRALEDLVEHPGLSIHNQRRAPIDLVKYLDDNERSLVLRRLGHVNEVLTGYRSGDPNVALPGEPRPQYDPSKFLKDRYAAKAAELDHEAYALLGEKMSVGTMRRLAWRIERGEVFEGVVDGRKNRRSPGRYRMPDVLADITVDVIEARRAKSTVTKSTLWLEVQGRARARLGKAWTDKHLPSESTWRRWVGDRYTDSELTGKARTRASATGAPNGGFSINVPTRPGQLVWMDTNSLDVLLKGTNIEDAVRGSLIIGLDAYSWSVCAVRVVEQAEKDIDISFAITDLGRPKQMMPGWPEEARWAFVGLPEQLIPVRGSAAEALGVSAMPFVQPEALGLDHGGPYKSQKTRDTAKRYGIDLLPARVRTGSDKAGVERFFGALRSMLLEKLEGYRGTDTSERGANVDRNVEWTAQRLEDEISKWVIGIWQTHILDDVKPPWCPEGKWSPNALYLHGIETTGVMPRMMTAEDYFGVLDSGRYKVHSRGVKVLGLFYDDPILDAYRNQPSPHPTTKWLVQYDRRDLRRVYLVDDDTKERHLLKWRGASGEFPCFGERHIQALRRRVKADNMVLDEHELAEVLLTEILPQPDGKGGATKDGKKANKAASRDARDAALAASDAAKFGVDHPNNTHPADDGDDAAAPADAATTAANAALSSAVEDTRRTRRQAATAGNGDTDQTPVTPAPRLGAKRPGMFGDLSFAAETDPTTDTDQDHPSDSHPETA